MSRIVQLVCSMSDKGNSYMLADVIKERLKRKHKYKEDEFYRVFLAEKDGNNIDRFNIKPCNGCGKCEDSLFVCANDETNGVMKRAYDRLSGSDAIIFSAPIYFSVPTKLVSILEKLAHMKYLYYKKHSNPKTKKGDTSLNRLLGKRCILIIPSEYQDTKPLIMDLYGTMIFLGIKPIFSDEYPYVGVSCIKEQHRLVCKNDDSEDSGKTKNNPIYPKPVRHAIKMADNLATKLKLSRKDEDTTWEDKENEYVKQ